MEIKEAFREWAIVEVMGHTVYAGLATDTSVGGQSYLRVDVPASGDRQAFTKLLGPGSIFSISPCDEATVRAFVDRRQMEPFDRYSLQDVAKSMAAKIGGPTLQESRSQLIDRDYDAEYDEDDIPL